jgi:putative glutathione S-transferase
VGLLVEGKWVESDVRIGGKSKKGEFLRKPVSFRGQISAKGPHAPDSGRYHLYVSLACPWAHRTLIMRKLKGLESHITYDVVSPNMLDEGWSFKDDYDSLSKDSLYSFEFLRDVYTKADPQFTGRVTVPILWDKKQETIVNNESSEIIRIFNKEFNSLTGNSDNYFPTEFTKEIEEWNELIYPNINNGVYRCGFARTQEAYEEAFEDLFLALNKVDEHLKKEDWLVGGQVTEADIRLFPTLVRFDHVYHTHFKCNGRLIAQYKGLQSFLDRFLGLPGVKETVNLGHIKQHYFYSHDTINPSRLVAQGPIPSP